jgi:hypothetical protein
VLYPLSVIHSILGKILGKESAKPVHKYDQCVIYQELTGDDTWQLKARVFENTSEGVMVRDAVNIERRDHAMDLITGSSRVKIVVSVENPQNAYRLIATIPSDMREKTTVMPSFADTPHVTMLATNFTEVRSPLSRTLTESYAVECFSQLELANSIDPVDVVRYLSTASNGVQACEYMVKNEADKIRLGLIFLSLDRVRNLAYGYYTHALTDDPPMPVPLGIASKIMLMSEASEDGSFPDLEEIYNELATYVETEDHPRDPSRIKSFVLLKNAVNYESDYYDPWDDPVKKAMFYLAEIVNNILMTDLGMDDMLYGLKKKGF